MTSRTRCYFFNYPMSTNYVQQVADITSGTVDDTKAYGVAMHGTSDFVSSADEHELIAPIVTRYHPGTAMPADIQHADHWEINTAKRKISASHTQPGVTL